MAKAKLISGLDAQASTGVNARLIAKSRLEEMYSWEASTSHPYNVQGLHNLRIAAKRLRYTLELFRDALPQECGPMIKEVEQIQEELGTLHDLDVMIALLRLRLGCLDSGTGYESALIKARQKKGRFLLSPDLVAHLLEPTLSPSLEQRQGLEQLLSHLQARRAEQFTTFCQHWSQLQTQHFKDDMLHHLEVL